MKNFNQYIVNILKPYRGLNREIYVLAISRFVNALGALIFPFMTLILSEKIGLDEVQTGFYTAFAGLLFIPAGLIGGRIADFFGRKRTIIVFECVGMLTYLVCVIIEPTMLMVYVLMMTAFSFGVAGPAHDAMIADFADEKQREGAYSLMYLGFNLGFAFSMILAGRLFANHLKLMFIIDLSTTFLALLFISFLIKEKYEGARAKDIIKDTNDDSIVDNELETHHKGSIFEVLKERPLLIQFAVLMFLYRLVYSQWSFLMPLHTVALFGDEKGGALYGNLGFVNALIVVSLTAIITRMFIKQTSIVRIVIAGIFLSTGFGLLGIISSPLAFYISVFVFTIGEIIEAISTMPYIMNHTPESHRGRMSAVIMTVMGVGFSIGPLILGIVLKYTSYSTSWFVTGILGFIGVGGMIQLSRKETIQKRLIKEEA